MSFGDDGLATHELPPRADELELSQHQYETDDGLLIATTRYTPVGTAPTAVLWCLAGGGCTRDFWDFEVRDEPRESYSFARYLARRGVIVVTADHLGAGDSSRPTDERLTSSASLASHMSEAIAQARRDPALADLPLFGVGHSFGAGMTLRQQDLHHDFDALVLLGWSSIQLAIVYADGVIKALGTPGKRARIVVSNLGFDADQRLVDANMSVATPQPQPAVSEVTTAGYLLAASRGVRVPVYLGFGEFDTLLDPVAETELYADAPSVTAAVLPGSYHFHNLQPGRELLWSGIADFVGKQATTGGRVS